MAGWADHLDSSRQRARIDRRRRAVALLADAALLPEHERAALVAHLVGGKSLRQIAAETGVPRTTLHRRLRRAVARTRTPEYRFLATRYEALPDPARRAARLRFADGLSVRQVARRTRQPAPLVRDQLRAFVQLVRLLQPTPRRPA